MEPVISVKEARKILGADSDDMSDDELLELIGTLDLLARDALKLAHEQLLMKKDANALASVIYDVYKDKKQQDAGK
jgi:hypothetical protein